MDSIQSALTVAILVSASAVAACGGDNKQDAKAPGNATTGSTAPQASATSLNTDATKTPDSETAANVHIDSAILKACGIPEPEAFFVVDSAILRPQDHTPLDKVAVCFLTGPLAGRGLRIVGHADPRGGHEYNMVLGQKRADSVQSYLLAKGMTKEKAESTTRGAMDAEGKDEPSWAKDRRVDVLLAQ